MKRTPGCHVDINMLRVVTVFGATGLQGGAVARALVNCPGFKVRAVTRNPNSTAAHQLKGLGCDVIKGNFDDENSIEACVQGASGCFLVTNFWEHLDKAKEIKQGKTVTDACIAAGVGHLVYSGLEHVQELAGLAVPHFDGKGIVENYIKETGIKFTFVRLPAYYENFFQGFGPRKVAEHKYVVGIPMGDHLMYGLATEDLGPCVRKILEEPVEYQGQTIGLCGDHMTIEEYCNTLSKYFAPDTFTDAKMTCESFEKLDFPGAGDLANMFRFYQMEDKCVRELDKTKKLYPKVLSFDDWVCANKEKLQKSFEK
ncbi:hypothetical protein ScPMuIL_010187 [Solemya velum]